MIRIALVALLALAAAFGLWFYLVPAPDKLSQLDWASGGGAGVEQVVAGASFGSHGQKLDVWRPSGSAGRKLPVIVFFYGGGWHAGTREGYAFAGRALAAQGFVVVLPDYRKVPDVRFPAFVADGAEAMRWVRDHVGSYGGDVGRIAVAGHSAGAYIAAMLGLDSRYLIASCADPHLIKAVIGLSGPYDFYPFTTENSRNAFAAFAKPRETQPISYARADAPPMLLVTSTADTTVKPRNAIALRDKLKSLGAPVEFRDYAGLNHEDVAMALSKPFRGKAPVLADSIAFLRKALGSGGQ
ncbi:MAG: alpha/beta hydrolase [Sphingomonas sp. 28-66-16]|nr:MAG: alpha/beta hydrolase [Sphingomonas sp. 28-66-16]